MLFHELAKAKTLKHAGLLWRPRGSHSCFGRRVFAGLGPLSRLCRVGFASGHLEFRA